MSNEPQQATEAPAKSAYATQAAGVRRGGQGQYGRDRGAEKYLFAVHVVLLRGRGHPAAFTVDTTRRMGFFHSHE